MITGLFSGQSNCVGIGPGGPFNINPLVEVWNNAPDREDALSLGASWVAPDRNANPFYNGNNNQGVHCAHYMAKAMEDSVRLLICGRSGRSIDGWHNGATVGPVYDRILDIMSEAAITSLDWFGWNQGTADNSSMGTYRTRWDAMLARMESDGFITSSTPIFLTSVGHYQAEVNPVLEEIVANDSRCALADIRTYPLFDGAHFTGQGLAHAGWESFRALASVPGIFSGKAPQNANNLFVGTGCSRKA